MATGRMKKEWLARLLVLALVVGFSAAALYARWADRTLEVHAAMPEKGGWLPNTFTAQAEEPLTLRLISDDVAHGFAIGQSDQPPVDILPGKPVEITLLFDKPGTYTYYCTRWCGPNHWRMRGTIEVEGDDSPLANDPVAPPLYLMLGIDLDAPHDVQVGVARRPSARRGAAPDANLPAGMLSREYIRAHSPYEVWQTLRETPTASRLSDADLWDLVARLWEGSTTPDALQAGAQLYAQNCATCHGTTGAGDGVFAAALAGETSATPISPGLGHETVAPTDFSDPAHMLGASPALLHGKIIRGGMGTGMPSWGLIFTDEQTWALTDYLWTFTFQFQFKEATP